MFHFWKEVREYSKSPAWYQDITMNLVAAVIEMAIDRVHPFLRVFYDNRIFAPIDQFGALNRKNPSNVLNSVG